MALLNRTKVGRDINRHHYTPDEVDARLRAPVVQSLLGLIKLRNSHPAFQGDCEVLDEGPHLLTIRWSKGAREVILRADLRAGQHRLQIA